MGGVGQRQTALLRTCSEAFVLERYRSLGLVRKGFIFVSAVDVPNALIALGIVEVFRLTIDRRVAEEAKQMYALQYGHCPFVPW